MKKTIRLTAAALAAITAMTCTSAAAFADKLRNIDGVICRYSDTGKEMGVYTGWANTPKGKVFYNKGVMITSNAVINGIRYKFSSDGYLTGKYTGWTKSSLGRRYWNDGILVKNKWLRAGSYYYYAGGDGYMIVEKSAEKYPALTALTEEEKQTLFSDFIKYKGDAGEWKGTCPEDLYIVKYYGKYNGCEVVVIWGNDQTCTDDIKDINIDGYTVSLGSGSFELLLHRNDTFISIESAYKSGYLSKTDIEKIAYYAEH